jgi:hypothetical protein
MSSRSQESASAPVSAKPLYFHATKEEAARILSSGFDPLGDYAELHGCQAGVYFHFTPREAKDSRCYRCKGAVLLAVSPPFSLPPNPKPLSMVFLPFDTLARCTITRARG